jgi:hypothetical protein
VLNLCLISVINLVFIFVLFSFFVLSSLIFNVMQACYLVTWMNGHCGEKEQSRLGEIGVFVQRL